MIIINIMRKIKILLLILFILEYKYLYSKLSMIKYNYKYINIRVNDDLVTSFKLVKNNFKYRIIFLYQKLYINIV